MKAGGQWKEIDNVEESRQVQVQRAQEDWTLRRVYCLLVCLKSSKNLRAASELKGSKVM